MGGGKWDTTSYVASVSAKHMAGKDIFDYSDTVHKTGAWKAHESLEPGGLTIRESRDSEEHPTSLAIAIWFDVTGSMRHVPRVLQEKLPALHGLIMRKGYVEHPQVLFAAVGDATCDKVPLQVGQFESDNRMDENLENIVLEGGGGGQKTESYELAAYIMARHTTIDCFDKRGKKGYLFFIGDEYYYPRVSAKLVQQWIGDGLQDDIPTEEIFRELQDRYEVYIIRPTQASYVGDPEVIDAWKKILGQNVIELENLDAVCETIALTIGIAEGVVDFDGGLKDLEDVGTDLATVGAVSSALKPYASNKAPLARSSGEIPDLEGDSGADRV